MTANPKWPEIERELLPGQTAADRPDLIAQVFQLKKKALIKAIVRMAYLDLALLMSMPLNFKSVVFPTCTS